MRDISHLLEGFDETVYLKMNPDVLNAVRTGVIPSASYHFISHGYREDRPGVSAELSSAIKNLADAGAGGPAPPEHLRERVHGDRDISNFEDVGRMVSFDIARALATVDLPDGSRILDFGCGCGRIMRYLHYFYPESKLKFCGTDIDAEAIAWCQSNLSYIGAFTHNEAWPPLPYEEGSFDLVYGISVFTHLPEDMQFAWLGELRRITKKGGNLLLTVHGEELFEEQQTTKKVRVLRLLRGGRVLKALSLLKSILCETRQFRKDGFCYMMVTATEGLPDFYKTSFHAFEYILRRWTEFFHVSKVIRKGIANNQDIVICTRK